MTRLPAELVREVHAFLSPQPLCALCDEGAAFRCAHRHFHAATPASRRALADCERCASLHSEIHLPLGLDPRQTYLLGGVRVQGGDDWNPRRFCLWHDYCSGRPPLLFAGRPNPSSVLPVAVSQVEPPFLRDMKLGLRAVARGMRRPREPLHCDFSSWVQLTHFCNLLQFVGIRMCRHNVHVTRLPYHRIEVHWVPLRRKKKRMPF